VVATEVRTWLARQAQPRNQGTDRRLLDARATRRPVGLEQNPAASVEPSSTASAAWPA
jgi:hypothetical protein